MGTVAPLVSEIFEKTGAYDNTMFLQKQFFFQNSTKIETKIINKLPVAMETVSRAYFACIVKFFLLFLSRFLSISAKKIFVCKNIAFAYAPTFSNISKTTSATIPIFELDL